MPCPYSAPSIGCTTLPVARLDVIVFLRNTKLTIVFEQPFFVAIEAKKDDFTAGWGQCGAEMVACQKINGIEGQTIFGIVSNGKLWEFGKLSDRLFTKNIKSYTIYELEQLFKAFDYIFEQCQLQVIDS
jgi:hypothetical protein